MPASVHPSAERGPSRIAGAGLMARADLPAGTTVVRFTAVPTSVDDLAPVNHSCEPTLAWADEHTLTVPRDVPTGTELTLDYATVIDDPDFVLFCHCETYRCRQVIEGTDWCIPQLQLRYAGQWHPAVQQQIDEMAR